MFSPFLFEKFVCVENYLHLLDIAGYLSSSTVDCRCLGCVIRQEPEPIEKSGKV